MCAQNVLLWSLGAATALRAGQALRDGPGFWILTAKNPDVAASFVARNLTWWWDGRNTDIAILTPTGRSRSRFLDRLLTRVSKKPFKGEGVSFGPFDVPWEDPEADGGAAIVAHLGLDQDGRAVSAGQIAGLAHGFLEHELCRWADAQRRLHGRVEFAAAEIHEQLARAQHRGRIHRHVGSQPIRAMTIHQAKNREFASVVIVWPLEIPTDAERRRRLLYNAVTRAKRQAVVIVQDLEGDVRARPPFGADTIPVP